MIRIPLFLVVAQWSLLFALGLLVAILYRQLGYVLTGQERTGSDAGPDVGSLASPFRYQRLSDGTFDEYLPGRSPTVLAFVDPTCPSCEELIRAMEGTDCVIELDGLRVLLVMSDPPEYAGISEVFQRTPYEVVHVSDPTVLRAYRATATPLLVGIDAQGTVSSSGPPVSADLMALRVVTSAARRVGPPVQVAENPSNDYSTHEDRRVTL